MDRHRGAGGWLAVGFSRELQGLCVGCLIWGAGCVSSSLILYIVSFTLPLSLELAFLLPHVCHFPSSGFAFGLLCFPSLLQAFCSPFPSGYSPFFSLFSPDAPWGSLFVCSFIHLFNRYTLSPSHIPGPFLGLHPCTR